MTDNEIVKALECCISNTDENCNKCVCSGSNVSCVDVLLQNALDLINRQNAEKEALINGQETLQKYIADYSRGLPNRQGNNPSYS